MNPQNVQEIIKPMTALSNPRKLLQEPAQEFSQILQNPSCRLSEAKILEPKTELVVSEFR